MKLHRFYIPRELCNLEHKIWLSDEKLLHQWLKVLRFKPGQEVVLFDGIDHDRLYKILEIGQKEVALELITEFNRRLPKTDVYLFWALLKKDKNDWVLQKCTELGVSHFIPLLADRCEKTGFDVTRATKIIIEAAEQCGRSDLPTIREPLKPNTAIDEYSDKIELYICEQDSEASEGKKDKSGVMIGPEGGWSDNEKKLFLNKKLKHLNLHDFTLRAETAAVAAVAKLIQ